MLSLLAIALFVVGDVAAGAFAVARGRRERGALLEELRAARTAERELYERLIQARKDGYEVPPPATPVVDTPAEPALHPELQKIVNDWEGEDARAAQMNVIRQYRRAGKSDLEILRTIVPATDTVAE